MGTLRLIDRLPPDAREPERLPLLRIRNRHKPYKEGLAACRRHIETKGLPTVTKPDEFVSAMLALEQAAGTGPTTIVGMLAIAPGITPEKAQEGLAIFEIILDQTLPSSLEGIDLKKILFPLVDNLNFSLTADMHAGLLNLEGNLANPPRRLPVGRCDICAPLVTAAALCARRVAGEKRALTSIYERHHTASYMPRWSSHLLYNRWEKGIFFNDIPEDARPSAINHPNSNVLICSSFGHIAFSLVHTAATIWHDRLRAGTTAAITKEEITDALSRLGCAEAILPYDPLLFEMRAAFLRNAGRTEEAQQNLAWAQAMDEVQFAADATFSF
jgi:hypothetical protein